MKQIAELSVVTKPDPEIYESEITAKFSLDMHGNTSVRCGLAVSAVQQAIERSLNAFLQSIASIDWHNQANYLSFDLHCFILDEDLFSETIEVGLGECVGLKEASAPGGIQAVCQQLVNQVRPRFFTALEQQKIELA